MKLAILAVLLAAIPAVPSRAAARARGVAVVMDGPEAAERPDLEKIARTLRGRPGASYYELAPDALADPIVRGRLLADLEARDLVVAVGDAAAEFAARELSDVPVYFVDVRLIRGERLASAGVSGTFSYNVESLLDAVSRLKLGRLGLAYTPGYEPVAGWIRAGAAARGLAFTESVIEDPREVAPAVRGLLESARTIWVLGDPLLARGAGFEFLRERALSRRVAIIMPGPWGVAHGALLAFEGDADPIARQAAAAVDAALSGRTDARERLRPAPPRGALLINGALAEKWGIVLPGGLPWRVLR